MAPSEATGPSCAPQHSGLQPLQLQRKCLLLLATSAALSLSAVLRLPAYRSSNGGFTSDNVGSDNSPGDLRLRPTFMQPYGGNTSAVGALR